MQKCRREGEIEGEGKKVSEGGAEGSIKIKNTSNKSV